MCAFFDMSGMGYRQGGDEVIVNDNVPNFNPNRRTRQDWLCEQHEWWMRQWIVKDLSLSYFQNKLFHHFDIAFQRNETVWPGRRNQQEQRQDI